MVELLRERRTISPLFNGPWGNRCLFKALSHAIQHMFKTGREPYPAERTLLTTAAVDAVIKSWNQNDKPVSMSDHGIPYQPADFTAFRESGATWSVITKDVLQSAGFEPRQFADVNR